MAMATQIYKLIKEKTIANRMEDTSIAKKWKFIEKIVMLKKIPLKLKMQLLPPLLRDRKSFERDFRLHRGYMNPHLIKKWFEVNTIELLKWFGKTQSMEFSLNKIIDETMLDFVLWM